MNEVSRESFIIRSHTNWRQRRVFDVTSGSKVADEAVRPSFGLHEVASCATWCSAVENILNAKVWASCPSGRVGAIHLPETFVEDQCKCSDEIEAHGEDEGQLEA